MTEEQELKAYKEFYENVQFAMDNALTFQGLESAINQHTEECCDALSIRH